MITARQISSSNKLTAPEFFSPFHPSAAAPVDEGSPKEDAARGQTGPTPYNAASRAECERITGEWPVGERKETDQ